MLIHTFETHHANEAMSRTRSAFLKEGLAELIAAKLLPEQVTVDPIVERMGANQSRPIGRGAFTYAWHKVADYQAELLRYWAQRDGGFYPGNVLGDLLDIIDGDRDKPESSIFHEWSDVWADRLGSDPLVHLSAHTILSQSRVDTSYPAIYKHLSEKTLTSTASDRRALGLIIRSQVLSNDAAFLATAEIMTLGAAAGTELYKEAAIHNLLAQ